MKSSHYSTNLSDFFWVLPLPPPPLCHLILWQDWCRDSCPGSCTVKDSKKLKIRVGRPVVYTVRVCSVALLPRCLWEHSEQSHRLSGALSCRSGATRSTKALSTKWWWRRARTVLCSSFAGSLADHRHLGQCRRSCMESCPSTVTITTETSSATGQQGIWSSSEGTCR